jgi:hypothetical protein
MVRPKIGARARNQSVTVKVTAAESKALKLLSVMHSPPPSSPGKGLRYLIDKFLGAK